MKFRNNIQLDLFAIIFVLCLILFPTIPAGNDDGVNEGTYYFGYGDSITAGKGTPNYCFYCSYIERMRVLYDPWNTSDHIGVEGGGNKVSYDQGPAWDENDENAGGTRYYYNWTNTNNKYFIFMLGVNDVASLYWHKHENGDEFPPNENYSVSNYTTGMLKIYNETLENGTIPIMCNPTGGDGADTDRYPGLAYENYSKYYNESFSIFKNYSIRCVPMWDALDLNPWDGVMQPFDIDSYQGSGVHPNLVGHDAMAEMLWYFINNWDYTTTYYSDNDTMIVEANYNQTIFINNTYWDNTTLIIKNLIDGTDIPFQLQTDFFGNEKIRFDVVKGEFYLVTDATYIPFLDCQGELHWNDVKAGSTVVGSYTIENIGEPTSELDWEILEYPDWGVWSFNHLFGENLTPEDGKFTIEVSVNAPHRSEHVFYGNITVVNLDDPLNFDVISVYLSIPRIRTYWIRFLDVFPVLQRIIHLLH